MSQFDIISCRDQGYLEKEKLSGDSCKLLHFIGISSVPKSILTFFKGQEDILNNFTIVRVSFFQDKTKRQMFSKLQ